MVLHYPNGKPFKKELLQPNTNLKAKNVIYGNRGMSLEEEINISNRYYLQRGKAVIHKKPTPIQIVNVDYPKRSAAVIKEAYFKQASTTDYNGVYRGYYLDFEAKETRNKNSFPLNNFHKHQIIHMQACQRQQGICFAIVKFSMDNELFLLPAQFLFHCWSQKDNGKKSIPKSAIVKHGYQIKYGLHPRIPYLDLVDKLIDNNF